MYKTLTPNIMVADVNATVKWYQDNLNFQFANQEESLDKPLDWAVMKAGNIQIFFQKEESLVKEMPILKGKKIGASLTFYIKVQDVQSLYNSVKEKVEIVRDMRETFYGAKEFAVKDLNGYILVFSEAKE
ncbi:VOC family protein [Patescibacteria group bacterium]|nr:VOC family protein [Patescibacteria group bacterium]MCG2702311.1 VOC family protein [Candidatus Parcubacteria bacterium]MBU4264590.1 VOC family protein [Patescibacteria group bacterium]MBU4390258.1 VOC family protein [Patescibacteria group bacterium]MBU4397328.1 VOC family protein [Patescibacteria group bacterium]